MHHLLFVSKLLFLALLFMLCIPSQWIVSTYTGKGHTHDHSSQSTTYSYTTGSIPCADAVTPVCTVVAGGDEEGVSAGITETEASAVAAGFLSQVKSSDIAIAINSLLSLHRMDYFFNTQVK
jgi:hypothetical protein